MTVTLITGGALSIPRQPESRVLPLLEVQIRWGGNPSATGAPEVDLSVFLVNDLGKVLSDEHFVFYNAPVSPDGAVRLTEVESRDNSSQRMTVDFGQLSRDCDGLVLAVSGELRSGGSQHFVPDTQPTLYLFTANTDEPLATYSLPIEHPEHGALTIGAFFRRGDGWQFRATCTSFSGGLSDAAKQLGVNIE